MTRKFLTLAAVALLAGAAPAWADPQKDAPPPAPDQTAAAESMKPPVELQKLAGWLGPWDAEQHVFASPMAPESRQKSRAFFHWILNGFHLEGVHNFQFMGKPMQGRSLWSYDPERKEYQCVWLDGMSPMSYLYTGNFTEDGKLVVKTSYTWQGKTINDAITYTFPTPDSYMMRYETDMSGTVQPMMEETGTRVKGGPKEMMKEGAEEKPAAEKAVEKAAPKKKR
jgi:hypothetical protein